MNEKLLHEEAIHSLKNAIDFGYFDNGVAGKSQLVLSEIYIKELDFKSAIEVLEHWKSNHYKNASRNSRVFLHNLGLAYLHSAQYKKAEENLRESYELNKRFKDTLGLARSSLDLANLYYVQYLDDQAIPLFKKGLYYAKKANDLKVLQNAYLNMSVVEENRKAYAKAIAYRKHYEKIKDSIWNRDKVWELAQKDKEIAVNVRESEIQQLKLVTDLQEAQIAKEAWRKNLFIVLAISLFTVAGLIGIFWVRTAQTNKLIKNQRNHLDRLNRTKDKLFSILTHDLKTPIHAIASKLLGLMERPTDAPLQQALLESYRLSKKTSLLMDNTLHWVLDNKEALRFFPEVLSLHAVWNQVLYDYRPILEEKTIHFKNGLKNNQHIW
ncbi:MAG: hypothetical protein AAGH81_18075, partial [Bacteroidota bacterium]